MRDMPSKRMSGRTSFVLCVLLMGCATHDAGRTAPPVEVVIAVASGRPIVDDRQSLHLATTPLPEAATPALLPEGAPTPELPSCVVRSAPKSYWGETVLE